MGSGAKKKISSARTTVAGGEASNLSQLIALSSRARTMSDPHVPALVHHVVTNVRLLRERVKLLSCTSPFICPM